MDEISKHLTHLTVMLEAIYGGGFESFLEMGDKAKDEYLWACADKAQHVRKLWESFREETAPAPLFREAA